MLAIVRGHVFLSARSALGVEGSWHRVLQLALAENVARRGYVLRASGEGRGDSIAHTTCALVLYVF